MTQNRTTTPSRDPDLVKIITSDSIEAARLTVEKAHTLGAQLKRNGLKTAQIRGVFGAVRLIELNWPNTTATNESGQKPNPDAQKSVRDLVLLKPKLAYQSERLKKHARDTSPMEPLKEALITCIDLVGEDRARFQRFVDFFEAVLAYHKAEGGE